MTRRALVASVFIASAAVTVVFLGLPLGALVWRAIPVDPLGHIEQPAIREALRLSLQTTAVSLILTVAMGTPTAYFLARRRFRGQALVETLIDIPIVLPPAVAGVALLMTFGRRGILSGMMETIGLEIAFSTSAVILAQVFVSLPFYVRTARAGFLGVDPNLEHASRALGRSPLQTFFYITAPVALPSLAAGAVMAWARALGEFGATIMFAGNFPGVTQTMPLAIYGALQSDFDAALALSLILVIVSFAVLAIFRLLINRSPMEGGSRM